MLRHALGALLFASLAGAAAADESLVVPSRPGVTVPVGVTGAAAPRAWLVLFVGTNGVVAQMPSNFLLRVKPDFAAAGYDIAVVDVPSDHRVGIDPYYRASAEAAADLDAVLKALDAKDQHPAWLIGTSMGSISAANGAARLGTPRIAGAVLTSSVWAGGMGLVPLGEIKVPVLVVHNRDDGCRSAPFSGAQLGVTQLANAPAHELIAVSGGIAKGPPCEAMSRHGYLGIEQQVVPAILQWIAAH